MPATDTAVCPFLGLQEDPSTCMGYPSPWNLCHHCRPASNIRLSHQQDNCLTPDHADCRVYQSQERLPFPDDLRARPSLAEPPVRGRK